jgi:hypothetical protein
MLRMRFGYAEADIALMRQGGAEREELSLVWSDGAVHDAIF